MASPTDHLKWLPQLSAALRALQFVVGDTDDVADYRGLEGGNKWGGALRTAKIAHGTTLCPVSTVYGFI